jgi:hypothetical protein
MLTLFSQPEAKDQYHGQKPRNGHSEVLWAVGWNQTHQIISFLKMSAKIN